jgi:hypothetical protein
MGPRPADFDEQLVRQSPTYLKWSALADGEKLRYACREFIKGHGDDDERLMRRIMIARRNNIRDHETLKKARRQSIQPLVALPAIMPNLTSATTTPPVTADIAVDVAPPHVLPTLQSAVVGAHSQTSASSSSSPDQVMTTTIKMEMEKFPLEASAGYSAHVTQTTAATNVTASDHAVLLQAAAATSVTHESTNTALTTTTTLTHASTDNTSTSASTTSTTRTRRPPHSFSDSQVEQEMDVAAVEKTRSYKTWMSLPEGSEFVVRFEKLTWCSTVGTCKKVCRNKVAPSSVYIPSSHTFHFSMPLAKHTVQSKVHQGQGGA